MGIPSLDKMPAETFSRYCLYCGSTRENIHYTCNCSSETWRNEYRTLDIKCGDEGEPWQHLVRKAFRTYSFDHPQGIMQYSGLPYSNAARGVLAVGLTPLFELKNISYRLNTEVHIKSEGHNPSGCFKDRETMLCLLNTKHNGLSRATIYSSGNAAASAAIFAQKNNLHLITVVSGDTYREKIDFIAAHGSDVIVIGDENTNFETGYRLFAKINATGFYGHCGYDNWSVGNPYRVQGDKSTAVEIIKQLGDKNGKPFVPDYVVVPSANGSCLVGLWKGFTELYQAGVIDSLPKMVSAGMKNASPIYKAVSENQLDEPSICDLSQVSAEDADIGSIILAEEGYDSIEAARAVVDSGGEAIEVTKSDIEETLQLLLEEEGALARDENIMPEPASLISIAAISHLKKEVLLQPWHRVVSVITGSGVKSREKIRELIPDDGNAAEIVEGILDRKKAMQYPESSGKGKVVHVEPQVEAISHVFNELKK